MRDQVFMLMRSVGQGDRDKFVAALGDLTLAMTRMQRVELQAKRVDAELAKIEAERAKLAAEAGDPREIYLLASQDLLKKLRSREPVRAVIDPIKEELIQEFTHGAEAFAKQIEASTA
jgi:predicted Mrr-cat superfamily restriction endonuclease